MKKSSRIAVLMFSIGVVLGIGVGDLAAANKRAPRQVVQKVKQRAKQAWSNHQRNKEVDSAISRNPRLAKFRAARISHYMKGVPAPAMAMPVPTGGYYMAKYGEAKRQAREDTVHFAASINQSVEPAK
jgi:hypothetical protein